MLEPDVTTVVPAADTGRDRVRALVVDDETYLAELVALALKYEGWQTRIALTGGEALEAAAAFRPDIVVLDVMLPDLDGFTVLQRLRDAGNDVPVVFLTARDAVGDRVSGLGLGGDDYVVKPFSLEELVARLRAVLRRSTRGPRTEPFQFADLVLDEEAHEARRAGRRIELTPTEFELLRFFLRNPNIVLSKAQILDRVWNYDFQGRANVVEIYVGYLRRKLERYGPRLIHTVRGVGYVLREPEEGDT